ncbi:lasso peptide biosynthesis B2 protein [Actinoallomurus sp. NPDC052274]|uniref:lasso peptide biosynthesis B2 protein n=1 Tax=Actinoallomurus sp. NPDC052274 TaxID=3155420 RepID=UPI00341642EC
MKIGVTQPGERRCHGSDMKIQVLQGRGGEYRLSPNVVLLRLPDGTGQLLDLDGQFYALSSTAVEMLHDVLDGGTASAAEKSAVTYSTPLSVIRRDLDSFLRDLTGRGLICPLDEISEASGRRSAILSRVVLILLRLVQARTRSVNRRMAALMTLSYVSVRILGWSQAVATWQACRRQNSAPTGAACSDRRRLADFIRETTRRLRARHPLPLDCKDQALCSWALLRDQGLRPTLVVGVAYPVAFHCWCELDGFIVSDDEYICRQHTPVARYT